MFESYAVGEIAIAHNWQLQCAHYNGSEVLVIGPLEPRVITDVIGQTHEVLCYSVRAADRKVWGTPPEWLRKRKDPGVSWSDLRDVWQPSVIDTA